MTRFQEERIRILRNEGLGYGQIASILRVDRMTIRDFCKKKGLAGRADIAEQKGKNCLCCGTPLVQIAGRKTRLFCSSRCKNKWWSHRRGVRKGKTSTQVTQTCIRCGRQFYSYPSAHRKYCSVTCSTEARLEKWKSEKTIG